MKRCIYTDSTAIGFSNQERIERAALSGVAGIGMTMVGLLLTGISFMNYYNGSAWYAASKDDLEAREKIAEIAADIKTTWKQETN